MPNSSIPWPSCILLCHRKEQEEGSGLDLAHYIAKPDIKPFVFILWSFLLVLAELPLFYGMRSFTSQPIFSVTKLSRPDRYFDLKVNCEVHFEQETVGEKNQRTLHIFMPFLDY